MFKIKIVDFTTLFFGGGQHPIKVDYWRDQLPQMAEPQYWNISALYFKIIKQIKTGSVNFSTYTLHHMYSWFTFNIVIQPFVAVGPFTNLH